ncbi:MAG: energy transducer TonB [Dysgonamonadaceae bacterium]|jgi:hypothetical protein|nr:energy transducer TonB [Dysgonamonadaceae bacterium]
MKPTLLLFFLSFSLIVSAQTADNNSVVNDTVYLFCDINPEYQDGMKELMKFITDSLIYPEESQDIQSKVIVRLIIEKDGTIEEMELLNTPEQYLAQEVMRVLSLTSGKWTAGEIDGKKVRSYFIVPVSIKMDHAKQNNNFDLEDGKIYQFLDELDEMPKFPGGESNVESFISKHQISG